MKRSSDQSREKNHTKNNNYYSEVALNKVKNKYEEAIQFQWIHLIAKKYNIYNIDNSHQCFVQHQSSGQNRKSNSNVVIPFPVIAPNFYGCIICGKYHFCNIDRRVCEIISDELDKIEMCRYSGKVLLVQDNLEPNLILEKQRMNSTRDALTFEKYVQVSYVPKGVKEKPNTSNNKKMMHTKKKQKLISRLKDNELLEKQRLKNKLQSTELQKSDSTHRRRNIVTISHNCDISIDSITDEEYNEPDNSSKNNQHQTVSNVSIIAEADEERENEGYSNNEYDDYNEDDDKYKNNISTMMTNENNTPNKPPLYLSEFDCESVYSDEDFLDKCYTAFDNEESFSTESSQVSGDKEEGVNHEDEDGLLSIIRSNTGRTSSKNEKDQVNGGSGDDITNMNHYVEDENDNIDELGFLNDVDIDDNVDDDRENNDDDGGGGGADGEANGSEYRFIDTGHGGAFTKNYHNNLEYNNRYYSFINTIIRKWKRKNDLHDLYNRDIQFESKSNINIKSNLLNRNDATGSIISKSSYSLNNHNGCNTVEQKDSILCVESSNTKNEFEKNVVHKYRFTLSENAKDRIRVETEKIVTHLLDIHKKVKNIGIDTSDLNISLVYYFTTLINNITSLVYGSDKINTIATLRNMKNQKQQKTTENLSKLLVTTIDLNEIEKNSAIREHEYTLDPKRICRSLMYSLLIEPFALNDSFGNRIDIWFRDPWLYTINKYHSLTTKERKEISKTNNIITECLASYNWCPVWVRSVVFNNIS